MFLKIKDKFSLVYGFTDEDLPGLFSIRKDHFLESTAPVEVHHHGNAIELCFVARGKQLFYFGEEEVLVNAGECLICHRHEPHSTGGLPQEKSLVFTIIIHFEGQGPFLGVSHPDTADLKERLCCVDKRTVNVGHSFKRHLDAIIALCEDREREMWHMSLLQHVIAMLLQYLQSFETQERQSVSPEIQGVVRRIESEPETRFQLSELAESCHFSLPHFKERFSREVGYTPHDFILRHKITHAAKELKSGSRSITDLAYRLGFSSSQYFSTVFKKYQGVSPSKFARH